MTAYFVQNPRRIEELRVPHLVTSEKHFEIVRTVTLGRIDYENFITDMLVERQFIEDNAAACRRGDIWKCLLVRQKGKPGGILVMPEKDGFVGYAAYITE